MGMTSPPEPLTGLLLSRREYESLADSATSHETFPTWTEWNKFQMRCVGASAKQGPMPPPWAIDVAAFRAWCEGAGTPPDLDALRRYALAEGSRVPWRH